jgi:hypothetical protein
VHFPYRVIAMVVEVRQCRIDLLGLQVGVLTEDLLGGLAVVIMLPREMDHLVTGPVDPGVAIGIKAQILCPLVRQVVR